ncbi:serine/threonine-protein kinase D1-like isoform X2 [Tigriopus californicus]|uniref:serine/threonine-protein kinase D1-like isoform X2 n=1 Tax=Tigriopus californicus TaxID=6832 RepID=UPI0027DA24B4|nr:serine/threonine-protein kinase D1-like isoform X2 [Tigriopus californicus]
MECSGHQISFQFQLGIIRDKVTVDSSDLNLKSLKSMATDFICDKCPSHEITRLPERVLLFRHDYQSSNILQMINAVTDIQEDTTVEVVINTQHLGEDDVEIRPHQLSIHSYKAPTFCNFCGEMLFGLFKQGLKCEGCGLNFHKRCVFKIPNDCSYKKRRRSSFSLTGLQGSSSTLHSSSSVGTTSTGDGSNFLAPPNRDGSLSPLLSSKRERSPSVISAGRPVWVDVQMAHRLKIPHTFVLHTYTKPTKCHFCNKMLVGVFKQGVQCKDCRYNAHKKCLEKVPRDCTGEMPDEVLVDKQGDSTENEPGYNGDDSDDEARTSPDSEEATPSHTPNTTTTTNPFDAETRSGAQSTQPNIPVQRLVQSVKQTKRIGSKILKEGWLVHFTNKGPMKKRHYWRLDTKSITLFQSDTGTNYYKEIPLSEILAVETAQKALSGSGGACSTGAEVTHCFEIRTTNVDYFVGEVGVNGKVDNDLGVELARQWEIAIRQALMPVQTGNPGTAATGIKTGATAPPPGGSTVPKVNRSVPKNIAELEEKDIGQLYQIFSDEILGSGQFGIVYGGVHRTSGHTVAVKVIDKKRFPTKQEAALKNEVSILQNLHHPGVVNLERMFETPEQIFVVMEKLKGDMLEMILSSEKGRLSERITRFIVTQILVALKHLHSKNIVHCDLKPENVLLSSDSDFPQVKLCDFGYARIIGKKSFRKSIVGTPAYLAPEVLYSNRLKKQGFNRALDIWSTGVIVYVSLSGQFPFNEDVDIEDQIKNAQFMYPAKPWSSISEIAIDFIKKCLVVRHDMRYTVDQALNDPFFNISFGANARLKQDLEDLEVKVGQKWLTSYEQLSYDEESFKTRKPFRLFLRPSTSNM